MIGVCRSQQQRAKYIESKIAIILISQSSWIDARIDYPKSWGSGWGAGAELYSPHSRINDWLALSFWFRNPTDLCRFLPLLGAATSHAQTNCSIIRLYQFLSYNWHVIMNLIKKTYSAQMLHNITGQGCRHQILRRREALLHSDFCTDHDQGWLATLRFRSAHAGLVDSTSPSVLWYQRDQTG